MSNLGSPSSDIGRKHRLKATTSAADSDSSDDSLIVPRKKNARTRVISQSSDSGSEVETRRRRRKITKPVIASESESDTGSIGDGQACPICLGKLDETTLQGRPESCEHTFCFECIIAWSKNNTTCPLCRNSFSNIKIILKGDVLDELSVKKVGPEVNEADQFLNDILCLVCCRSDQEDSLLLCDECDDAYHCACLQPPLMSVPPGQWFCPRCSQVNVDADSDDDSLIPRYYDSVYLPRTRATERVRRAVQSTRRTATNQRTSRQGNSGGRRRTTRGSSTTARTTSGRSRKTIKRKKTRRKTRRRKGGRRLTILRKAYAASMDQQWRIARSLGLSDRLLHKLNRNNVSFPVLSTDEPSTSRGTSSRAEPFGNRRPLAGVTPNLTIFGSKNDYVPQGSSDDDDELPSNQNAAKDESNTVSGVDFLGGLLEKQSILLNRKSELKSNADGTLRLVSETSPSSTGRSTSTRTLSTETSSPSTPRKSVSVLARAPSSSLEYDVRYKPQRISRVHDSCVAMIANTIEDVVNSSCAYEPEPQPARNRREPRRSNVPYANEAHNVARARAVEESLGWINSLKLTVPTVINSLSIVEDVDVASCSSTDNHRRVEMKSEYVRVKQEPKDYDDRSGRHSHHEQKKRSHYTDPKRDRRREPSNDDRKGSTRHRRSPSQERNRNRKRSRSPIVVKREKRSRSRERTTSPARHSSNFKTERRRSRSREPRKESSHQHVKNERRSPSAARANSRQDEKLLDRGQMVSPLREQDNVVVHTDATSVDLSRVKTEPLEYSSPDSDLPEPSAGYDIKIKTEPSENISHLPLPEIPPLVDSHVTPNFNNDSTQIDAKTWIHAESSQCQSFPTVPHASTTAEAQLKVEPSENSATMSNMNSSVHLEGYSSGVDSEDSSSDVAKAVVGTVADTKPVAKSEPPKYTKYFVSREKFKDAVIKEVGPYLKKFYKKHQISKEDYKEIFKKVLKKVCTSSSEKKRLVCTKAIHKLCHIYVKRARIQIKLDCKFGEND